MSFKLGRDHIIKCLGHLTSIQQGAIEGFSEKKGHVQIHLLERHVKELLALWLAESSPFAPFVNREEYCSGLPFFSPVDHILSDLSTMTCLFWVAPQDVA